MTRIAVCLGIGLGLMSFALHAKASADYIPLTALEKQDFHRTQALLTQYSGWGQPGLVRTVCGNAIGMSRLLVGKVWPRYTERTMHLPSGYATGLRYWFGKPVHSQAVTASGEVTFNRAFFGYEANEPIPVTYRFSRAVPHIPGLPGAEHRPSLLVMFHRDGLEDASLFMMPPTGLTGFRREVNPFSVTYTHWLDKPSAATMLAGNLTFGAAANDILTQFIQHLGDRNYRPESAPTRKDSPQLFFNPESDWIASYDETDNGLDWRQRMEKMWSLPLLPSPLFNIDLAQGEGGEKAKVGLATVKTAWVSSRHSDLWISRHTGFIERQ